MSARELTYAQAIQEALAQAMDADPNVFLMGEDIGVYGGAFQVTGDLVHRYGEERVMDAPISELGQAGIAVGAALAGCRPVLEFQFSDFATLAMEQIVRRNLTIRGIHNYGSRHLSQAVEFLQQVQHVYPFESIVSQWFSLQNVAAALDEAMNPKNIRVGVKQ